jgi:hypothetical protein
MAVFELSLLCICWLLAALNLRFARKLFDFAQTLPPSSWYWPNAKLSDAAKLTPAQGQSGEPRSTEATCSAADQRD